MSEDALGCESFDACSPTFEFAGEPFAAEHVVFVVDRSGSMMDSGELELATGEIRRTLSGSGSVEEFAVIFFDSGVLRFPASADGSPAAATPESIDGALARIAVVRGGSESCLQTGFEAALSYVENASAPRHAILYVGDGGGTCSASGMSEHEYLGRMIEEVTEGNAPRAQINAFGVLMTGRLLQAAHLTDLAERNGGRYFEVTR